MIYVNTEITFRVRTDNEKEAQTIVTNWLIECADVIDKYRVTNIEKM